jgi:hypothetical protein
MLFVCSDTSIGTLTKFFDFITTEDCPTFDKFGKTNLCIDDAEWTPNDVFVIVAFKSKSIAVVSRLGTLVGFINPTLVNLTPNMVD